MFLLRVCSFPRSFIVLDIRNSASELSVDSLMLSRVMYRMEVAAFDISTSVHRLTRHRITYLPTHSLHGAESFLRS